LTVEPADDGAIGGSLAVSRVNGGCSRRRLADVEFDFDAEIIEWRAIPLRAAATGCR